MLGDDMNPAPKRAATVQDILGFTRSAEVVFLLPHHVAPCGWHFEQVHRFVGHGMAKVTVTH